MRFLTTILLLTAATVFAQVPIKRAVLQSDLNAGGYSITNVMSVLDVNGDPITGGGGSGDISSTSSNNLLARKQLEEFTIYYKGDMHAGTNSYGPYTANRWTVLKNEFNRMLSEASSLNVKAFISAGDCIDDSLFDRTNSITDLTNQLWRFVNTGIPFISCMGNHEGDQLNNFSLWAQWFGPLLTASGLTAQSASNDYVECIFLQTNSNLKMGFVTLRDGYLSTLDWLNYCATNWPDHRLLVLNHTGLGGNENIPYVGAFQPLSYEAISKHPNVFMAQSGHYRDVWSWAHLTRDTDAGAVTWVFMNTQSQTNAGAHLTRYYRFKPLANIVEAKTFDAALSSFLTNGQMTTQPVISSNGIAANFTFPIKSGGKNPNYLRLAGRDKAYRGDFNTNANAHLGSWSRPGTAPYASNELFDTAITFDRRTSYGGFAALDSFALGRFYDSTNLVFKYGNQEFRDAFSAGPTVLSISTGGVVSASAFVGSGAGLTGVPASTRTNVTMLQYTLVGSASYPTNVTTATPVGYWLPDNADALTNFAEFAMAVPSDFKNSTVPYISFAVAETGTATGDAVFALQYGVTDTAVNPGVAISGTSVYFTNAVGQSGTGYRASLVSLNWSALTNALTAANSGKLLRILVARDGDSAADTIATNLVLMANPTLTWQSQ